MIAKMKKISLISLESQREKTLKQLKKLGLLHLEELEGTGEVLDTLQREKNLLERAMFQLPAKKKRGKTGEPDLQKALAVAESIQADLEELRGYHDSIDRLGKEYDRVNPWGDFDPSIIGELAGKGVHLKLVEFTDKSVLPEGTKIFPVRSEKSLTRAAILLPREVESFEVAEFPLPEYSLSAIREKIGETEEKIKTLKKRIEENDREPLENAVHEYEDRIEFETYRTGLGVKDSLIYLTGYIPTKLITPLKDTASKEGWGLLIRDPEEQDPVPTLVENPKAVSIIQPVFDLLGTIPGYREFDISFFFLLFFTLFFAMIIGDAGYGLILLCGTVFGLVKSLRKGINPGLVLLAVLSLATLGWGAITGTWFGSQTLAELPFLSWAVIPSISSFDPRSNDVVQYLCFIIGTIHLSVAHLWNFFSGLRKKPVIKAFAQLGWLSMVLGLFYLVLQLVLGIGPMPQYALYMILGGLAAVLVLSEQEGNFFKGIFKGLGNIMPIFLDSIGAFSDIISYIRLFAVGLASVEIAKSFNAMASGMDSGVVGIIGGILILLLGHSLNLAMGALSVIVHGVRLNMLEFSGHLGMEWTGIPYKPFEERKKRS